MNWALLAELDLSNSNLEPETARQAYLHFRYAGYIKKEVEQVERFRRMEQKRIPERFPYEEASGLRHEARLKLSKFRPATLGQASRISGVSPADVQALMVLLKRHRAPSGDGAAVDAAPAA